jgi:Na+/H+ antiporter NhaD/arsenite permease-like protein
MTGAGSADILAAALGPGSFGGAMWIPVVVFAIVYLLIAFERVDKTIAACLGAGAVIMLRSIPYDRALSYIDLNVIFLLVGMMMLVGVLARTGLFEWMAILIAQKARGNGVAILIFFVVITALTSALLDNVTTVILIAPITILVCQVLELPAVPFLILEAVFSNIGGTATLVGDPPNIMIGSRTGLGFNEFILHLAPAVGIVMVVALAAVLATHRGQLHVRENIRTRVDRADPAAAITDHRNLRRGLVVFGFVLAGFFAGRALGVAPGIVALVGGMAAALVCKSDLREVIGKVEWNTLMFFVGLFMLVGSMQEAGVFMWLGRWVVSLTRGDLLLTTLMVLWVSAIASAIVDNIPFVMAMIPLIQSIIPAFALHLGIPGDTAAIHHQVEYPLFWALALGACLGGNGTLIGASANVVISQIGRRNGYDLSFSRFTRLGFPLMILSVAVCTVYVWVRYFLL